MKTYADHRGMAIILEDESEIDIVIDRLQRIKEFKRKHRQPYPAVYVYTPVDMHDEQVRQFHNEIWFMHYTTQHTPRHAPEDVPAGAN